MEQFLAERISEILMADPDISYATVADVVGCSRNFVGWVARNKLNFDYRWSPVSAEDKKKIAAMIGAQLCDAEIARQLGLHACTVGDIRRRNGIKSIYPSVVFTEAQRRRAVRLVNEGKSFGEAAMELGMTRNAVAGAVNRARQKKAA